MSGVKEIPEKVRGARRRLYENEDLKTILQWAAEEHGVGVHAFEEDGRLDQFENGQRRAITFLAETLGVPLFLVNALPLEYDEKHNVTE